MPPEDSVRGAPPASEPVTGDSYLPTHSRDRDGPAARRGRGAGSSQTRAGATPLDALRAAILPALSPRAVLRDASPAGATRRLCWRLRSTWPAGRGCLRRCPSPCRFRDTPGAGEPEWQELVVRHLRSDRLACARGRGRARRGRAGCGRALLLRHGVRYPAHSSSLGVPARPGGRRHAADRHRRRSGVLDSPLAFLQREPVRGRRRPRRQDLAQARVRAPALSSLRRAVLRRHALAAAVVASGCATRLRRGVGRGRRRASGRRFRRTWPVLLQPANAAAACCERWRCSPRENDAVVAHPLIDRQLPRGARQRRRSSSASEAGRRRCTRSSAASRCCPRPCSRGSARRASTSPTRGGRRGTFAKAFDGDRARSRARGRGAAPGRVALARPELLQLRSRCRPPGSRQPRGDQRAAGRAPRVAAATFLGRRSSQAGKQGEVERGARRLSACSGVRYARRCATSRSDGRSGISSTRWPPGEEDEAARGAPRATTGASSIRSTLAGTVLAGAVEEARASRAASWRRSSTRGPASARPSSRTSMSSASDVAALRREPGERRRLPGLLGADDRERGAVDAHAACVKALAPEPAGEERGHGREVGMHELRRREAALGVRKVARRSTRSSRSMAAAEELQLRGVGVRLASGPARRSSEARAPRGPRATPGPARGASPGHASSPGSVSP